MNMRLLWRRGRRGVLWGRWVGKLDIEENV
jgi:hypothetical protein